MHIIWWNIKDVKHRYWSFISKSKINLSWIYFIVLSWIPTANVVNGILMRLLFYIDFNPKPIFEGNNFMKHFLLRL